MTIKILLYIYYTYICVPYVYVCVHILYGIYFCSTEISAVPNIERSLLAYIREIFEFLMQKKN